MEKTILIVTAKPDPHPTSVIELMRERHINFFRLNTDALLTDYEFSWLCDNQREDLVIKNVVTNQKIHGNQIKSIWWRRPIEPTEMKREMPQHVKIFNLVEAKAFCNALMYYLSSIYSIGSFLYNRYAGSKMVQLRLAARLGFTIPDTCITNTKNGVRIIADKYSEVLVKPLGAGSIKLENDMEYEFYAKRIPSSCILSLPIESFEQTINFCENYVAKNFEVRVTVMGPYIFACKLDSQVLNEDEGKIDWRQGYDFGLKHEMIDMPENVKNFCFNYLHELNLNFGCFDFIVRPDGEYVFLECNPNGQWAWIEDELKVSCMREAMIDCLVNCLKV